jgi:hypothetical protein
MSWFGQNVDLGWSATLIRLARPSRAVVHRARTRSTRSGSTPHDHHSLSAQNRPASRRPSRGHGNSRSNGRKPPQLNQSPSINKAPFDQTYPLHSPPQHQTARQVDPPPLRPPSSPILNPHSARGTAAPSLIAVSSLGGFPTPAAAASRTVANGQRPKTFTKADLPLPRHRTADVA